MKVASPYLINTFKDEYHLNEQEQEIVTNEMIDSAMLKIVQKHSIKKIPVEDLKKAFINYWDRYNMWKVVQFGPHYISESLDFEDRLNELREKLQKVYKLEYWQMQIEDFHNIGQEQIYLKLGYNGKVVDLIIPNIDENERIITEFMNQVGYTLIRKIPEQFNDNISFCHLMYSPMKQKNVRTEIERLSDALYHISPSWYEQSILSKGLVPKSRTGKSGVFYPARTYLSYDEDKVVDYKKVLGPGVNSDDFVLYRILLGKLPKDIEIFVDPLMGLPFVFVEEFIPAMNIEKVRNI